MKYASKKAVAIFLALLIFSGVGLWLFSETTGQTASGCATPSFAVVVSQNINNSINALALGDLNGDTKPDLVTANYYSDQLSILIGNGVGNFMLSSTTTTGQRPSAVVLGDFNQDGKLDLAVGTSDGRGTNAVVLLLGDGQGGFAAPLTLATPGYRQRWFKHHLHFDWKRSGRFCTRYFHRRCAARFNGRGGLQSRQ